MIGRWVSAYVTFRPLFDSFSSVKASALLAVLMLSFGPIGLAADIFIVRYPASARTGELQIPVDFHVWIPPGEERLRAVIVHQHGCGEGAEMSGETAALDLHWQA